MAVLYSAQYKYVVDMYIYVYVRILLAIHALRLDITTLVFVVPAVYRHPRSHHHSQSMSRYYGRFTLFWVFNEYLIIWPY